MKKKYFNIITLAFLFAFIVSGSVRAEDHEQSADDAAPVTAILFVELNPLMLPVIDRRGVSRMVSLVVAVEVDNQEKADTVTKYAPRLTDAFLSDLYGALGGKMAANGGNVPITYLKERLNNVSARVLGENIVSDVLIQLMHNRPT